MNNREQWKTAVNMIWTTRELKKSSFRSVSLFLLRYSDLLLCSKKFDILEQGTWNRVEHKTKAQRNRDRRQREKRRGTNFFSFPRLFISFSVLVSVLNKGALTRKVGAELRSFLVELGLDEGAQPGAWSE